MMRIVPAGALTVDVPLGNVAVHGSSGPPQLGSVFVIANSVLSPGERLRLVACSW